MELFIFIIFAFWIRSTAQLTEHCEFQERSLMGRGRLTAVKCKDAFLGQIPSDLPKNINYLEIESDMIENITLSSFTNYPLLEYLLLKHCGIYYVEAGAFSSLKKLVYVDLSGNNIEELPPLPPSVETLSLNSMSKRSTFFASRQTYHNIVQLESLKKLLIKNNNLQFLPSFVRKMMNLNEILVNKNAVNELSVDDIVSLCNLKVLDFTGNYITKTEKNTCNCLFVHKWASKYNTNIYNLTCPQIPALGIEKCEIKFPQDLDSQDRTRAECLNVTRSRNYLLYSVIISLISFILLIVGYYYLRKKRTPKKIDNSSSAYTNDALKIPEENMPLEISV